MSSENREDDAKMDYQLQRISHWDTVARKMNTWSGWGGYYHKCLKQIYRSLVSPGKKVMEIGCAHGDLLAELEPSVGVGVDFSPEMIKQARIRHPELKFYQSDAHDFSLEEKFDVIILSELVNDLWDVQTVIQQAAGMSSPKTRLIINFYSHIWQVPLTMAQRLGLANPLLSQNWLTIEDITCFLTLADFEIIRRWEEILLPLPIPGLSTFVNRFLVKVWPFSFGAFTHFVVARPLPTQGLLSEKPKVSVIIPTRNEAGNITDIFARVPELGGGTELIFVEGHSCDDTYKAIEQTIADHPKRQCKLLRQSGDGKGDAVRLGFSQASGDMLMILDADLAVSPQDLQRFYEILRSGKGEFVNGVRTIYPMENQAMRFFNLIGNKFFSLVFAWILGQPIKDTLCGTKALWKSDYDLIKTGRAYFGEFDPFGDFDLLFGAARLNLKIVDLAIRYRERTYGSTNIKRWRHGWLLLRMTFFAARRIKFI